MAGSRVQIEGQVLAIYDAVCSGSRIEDSRVELKSSWPEPEKAARRVAAHVNAARGELVIWVLGLDETEGFCPLEDIDLATWWQQVQAGFDGVSPGLTDFVVLTDDGPLQVLVFDGALGPFVVTNPVFGRNGAGPVQREVPWREGTSVRSATRGDLVRLLVPLQQLPDVEFISGSVHLSTREPGNRASGESTEGVMAHQHLHWSVKLELYVTPVSGTVVVFPVHRTAVAFRPVGRDSTLFRAEDIRYWPPTRWTGTGSQLDTASLDATRSEAIIRLPGRLNIEASYREALREVDMTTPLVVRFVVTPVHTEHSIQVQMELPPVDGPVPGYPQWILNELVPEIAGW